MTQTIQLEMNDYLPLRDVVFQTLRQAILRGKLEPGGRLMELHLADMLGVSRTPVREAIRKLELEGLVITIPRRGAVVAQITRTDLEDVLEVRCALEELAVRKACQKMTPEQLILLKQAASRFEKGIAAGDLMESAQADVDFHEVISDATGNRRLIQILNNIRSQVYRYRLENLKNKASHPDLIREHTRLIEALERHDEEEAARFIRVHIENQRMAIMENLQLPDEK